MLFAFVVSGQKNGNDNKLEEAINLIFTNPEKSVQISKTILQEAQDYRTKIISLSNFDVKFRKAQDRGAKAVIIYNPDLTQPIINMSGADGQVTIPGVLINHAEGELIKSIQGGGKW